MPKNKEGRRVVIELMFGPSDGQIIEDTIEGLIEKGFAGSAMKYPSRGHMYESKRAWNGVARRIALYDRGPIKPEAADGK